MLLTKWHCSRCNWIWVFGFPVPPNRSCAWATPHLIRCTNFLCTLYSSHENKRQFYFPTLFSQNLSVDLGSTDERLYDTSDIMNRSNYRLEVSLRIMNHDSISSIKTAQVNLSSLVNFKIQAVHKRAQSVEIPRNAVSHCWLSRHIANSLILTVDIKLRIPLFVVWWRWT